MSLCPRKSEVLTQSRVETCRLGAQDLTTIKATVSTATLYQEMGQLERALPLCEDALVARRSTLGEEHRETLLALNTTGNLLYEMGDLERARTLCAPVIARTLCAPVIARLRATAPSRASNLTFFACLRGVPLRFQTSEL
eukprot:SAG11_NODE_4155_length_2037_cov_0.977296_2_plen_140_part_00